MLLFTIKTKEGLVVMESPHKPRIDAYMRVYGKIRGFVVSKRIVR
jgi:hypothetical protein